MDEVARRSRRRFLALALAPAAAPSRAEPEAAYPWRPVRLVCPSTPGSSPDVLARWVAQQLALQLGQPVVVENVPGAGTTRGTAVVAGAAPDGHTLLATFSPTFSASAALYKSAHYDPERSFTPIGSWARITPFMVVNADVPARNLAEYVALARRSPQKLEFAHSGAAGVPLLLGTTFARAAGIELLFVPYGSEAESRQDVLSGRVSTAVFWAPVTLQHTRSGKLRPLAYAGLTRHPALPEVPTFAEQGYPTVNFQLEMLLLGPAGLPRDTVQRLSAALAASLRVPAYRAELLAIGIEPVFGSPEDVAGLVHRDGEQFAEQARALGLKQD